MVWGGVLTKKSGAPLERFLLRHTGWTVGESGEALTVSLCCECVL